MFSSHKNNLLYFAGSWKTFSYLWNLSRKPRNMFGLNSNRFEWSINGMQRRDPTNRTFVFVLQCWLVKCIFRGAPKTLVIWGTRVILSCDAIGRLHVKFQHGWLDEKDQQLICPNSECWTSDIERIKNAALVSDGV